MEDAKKVRLRKKTRIDWVEKVYKVLPSLKKIEEPAPSASDSFWGLESKPATVFPLVPIHKGLLTSLEENVQEHFNALRRKVPKKKSLFDPVKT